MWASRELHLQNLWSVKAQNLSSKAVEHLKTCQPSQEAKEILNDLIAQTQMNRLNKSNAAKSQPKGLYLGKSNLGKRTRARDEIHERYVHCLAVAM